MSVRKMVRASLLLLPAWLLPACSGGDAQTNNLVGGNAKRGIASIQKYGCGSCHTIPGIRGAHSLVGPNLSGVAGRVYIAGVLTNSPDHLVDWIRNPQTIDDKTAMPNLSVSARDARDIAAYLYTLR
jgi:cytochrome c